MNIQALVYSLPQKCRAVSITKHTSNSVHIIVHTYDEATGKTVPHEGHGFIIFDSPEFDNQMMKVAAEFFGLTPQRCIDATPKDITKLLLAVMQFKQ